MGSSQPLRKRRKRSRILAEDQESFEAGFPAPFLFPFSALLIVQCEDDVSGQDHPWTEQEWVASSTSRCFLKSRYPVNLLSKNEIVALHQKQTFDEDEVRIGQPSVQQGSDDSFFEHLQAEVSERQSFTGSSARPRPKRPSVEELWTIQQRQAECIANLDRSVGRLSTRVRLASLLNGAMVVAMMTLAAFLYFDTRPTREVAESRNSEARADRESSPSLRSDSMSDLLFESDSGFKIRTDTDHRYQLIIRQLYSNLQAIRRPSGPIEVRNAANEDYIHYMSDVSKVIQQAARDQPSSEILQALMHLGTVGSALRKVDRTSDLDVELQNKLDQIQAVLLAPDQRIGNADPEPFPAKQ